MYVNEILNSMEVHPPRSNFLFAGAGSLPVCCA